MGNFVEKFPVFFEMDQLVCDPGTNLVETGKKGCLNALNWTMMMVISKNLLLNGKKAAPALILLEIIIQINGRRNVLVRL